jgi:hypothetical protein
VDDLKMIQPGDPNLHRDYIGYRYNGWYGTTPPPWNLALTYFHQLRGKRGVSWSCGIRYRQPLLGGTGFTYDSLKPRDIFTGNQGQQLVRYDKSVRIVAFSVAAYEVMLPTGIYWSGKKQRLLWVEAGAQFAPGIIFGASYQYYEVFSVQEIIVPVGEDPEEKSSSAFVDSVQRWNSMLHVNGVGYSLYIGLPVSLYLRFSKKHSVFSRVELMANLTPFLRYSFFPELPTQDYFSFSVGTGVRYRL